MNLGIASLKFFYGTLLVVVQAMKNMKICIRKWKSFHGMCKGLTKNYLI